MTGVLFEKLLLLYSGDCSYEATPWGCIPRGGETVLTRGGPVYLAGDVPGNSEVGGGPRTLCSGIPTPPLI